MRARGSFGRLAGLAVVVALISGGCGTAAEPKAQRTTLEVDRALHDALPTAVRDRGVITVAVDPSGAPLQYYGPDGRTVIGMEPDLMRTVGELLGVKVEFRDTDFDKILDEVAAGHVDIGLSSITDTAERAQQVDFVDYFSSGTAIMVQRGNPNHIASLEDLCGRVVAAESGTVQVGLLKRTNRTCATPITVKTFTTNSDALLRLRTGRVTAMLADMPPAAKLTTDRRTRAFYQLASSRQYEPGNFGIAVNKDDQALRSVLVKALESLQRGGQYAATLRHWHLQDGAIEHPQVNSGR